MRLSNTVLTDFCIPEFIIVWSPENYIKIYMPHTPGLKETNVSFIKIEKDGDESWTWIPLHYEEQI